MSLSVIILAAGQGKRMRSNLPKVLHPLGGKPLLHHVITTAQSLNPESITVIYGHEGAQVRAQCSNFAVQWTEQRLQLGTGHAVAQAMPNISPPSQVLILVGDAPLISSATLKNLLAATPTDGVGLVTVQMPDPTGLGRILRDKTGKVIGVVEEKDTNPEQKKIQEINTGIITASAAALQKWLPLLNNKNAQEEYYLPDIIPLAVTEGFEIATVSASSTYEVQGINDRTQLALLERYYQQQQAQKLMLSGVTLLDPTRFDLRGEVISAEDVTIDVNVVIEGKVTIGTNTYIGPNCILRNVKIGENVTIKANSIIEDAEIAADCIVGPFARIRPGTKLDRAVHVGNFVEVKKAIVGPGSKINHLSYIGDAQVGQGVNIGAGTITCNYDGVDKHLTTLGDHVFVGSDTLLVAPVTVGAGATIAAGSTVTKDAPAGELTVTQRLDQRTVPGWHRRRKDD